MHFLANIECWPKFLEYALLVLRVKLFEFYFQNDFLKYLNKFAHENGRKPSSNLAKSKSSNQSKSVQSYRDLLRTQSKILAFVYRIAKKAPS